MSDSNGSRMSKNPLSYVATSVAKEATFCSEDNSSSRGISSVRTSDESRSAQNLEQPCELA
jgi:hypothetical protein